MSNERIIDSETFARMVAGDAILRARQKYGPREDEDIQKSYANLNGKNGIGVTRGIIAEYRGLNGAIDSRLEGAELRISPIRTRDWIQLFLNVYLHLKLPSREAALTTFRLRRDCEKI